MLPYMTNTLHYVCVVTAPNSETFQDVTPANALQSLSRSSSRPRAVACSQVPAIARSMKKCRDMGSQSLMPQRPHQHLAEWLTTFSSPGFDCAILAHALVSPQSMVTLHEKFLSSTREPLS